MAQGFPPDLARYLKEINAVLIRANKHRVYELPNGRRITVGSSPSTPFYMRYVRNDVKKALKLQ